MQPKTIIITGAESTGKSELTLALAKKYNAPFVHEFARSYVEGLNRRYNYQDVELIAKRQINDLNQLKNTSAEYIFADTWLIITKVWFDIVFNQCPDWIERVLRTAKIDLFLVCDIDLPWIPDRVRENGGERRIVLHNKYISLLDEYGFNYRIVSGFNEERINHAVDHLSSLSS